MKKSLALILSLILVLLGSVAASAFEAPKVTVGAGYLFGNAALDMGQKIEFADKGLVFTADATVTGPFGVMVTYVSLTGSDFKSDDAIPAFVLASLEDTATRTDILASYAPSFGKGGLRLLAGYSTTEEKLSSLGGDQTTTVKGPMVGAALAVPVNEKLIVSGFAGYGVGMTWETSSESDTTDGDANLLTYRVAATYLVHPNVGLEAGYIGNNYTLKSASDDFTEDVGGFFAGARALF